MYFVYFHLKGQTTATFGTICHQYYIICTQKNLVPRVTNVHVELAINQLHIRPATGNQLTAYHSIGTHNKIDNLNHQDNGILVASYFSSSILHIERGK